MLTSVAGVELERAVEFDRMLSLFRALGDEAVEYVLVDAAALNLHGIIRATEDVDLFIRSAPDNVERLRRIAARRGTGGAAPRTAR